MKQQICAITVVVPNYDEALRFYVGALGFDLVEDTPLPDAKRWVVVTPGRQLGNPFASGKGG